VSAVGPPSLAGTLGRYTLARAGLVAAVAGLLVLAGAPLAIAVLVGLVVTLPLSMVLFRGLRARMDAALAQRDAQRAVLRSRLRGKAAPPPEVATPAPSRPDDPSEPGEYEPDPGRG